MNKMINSLSVTGILITTLFILSSCDKTNNQSQKIDKPNVLFISVDDLNDWTGFLGGHPQAQTPHLVQLADSGLNFKFLGV